MKEVRNDTHLESLSSPQIGHQRLIPTTVTTTPGSMSIIIIIIIFFVTKKNEERQKRKEWKEMRREHYRIPT